jgi:hypothetical protein
MFDTLKAWLEQHDCKEVFPIRVTIKGTSYEGVEYFQNNQYRIYLLGDLPSCYKRSRRTCFRLGSRDGDYYIACYANKNVTGDLRYQRYHPCGPNFMLSRWDVPDGSAIDAHEQRPFTRVQCRLNLFPSNVK